VGKARWASEVRRAVLSYLLKGERAPRLLEGLRDNSPVWLATASALDDSELAVGLAPHDRMRLRAALFPETLKVVEPDAYFAERLLPNVRRFLEAVSVWWAQEGPALAYEYGSKLYPEGFESSSLREPYSPGGRIGWFTLLALASFSSMGRTREEQHRSFIMAGLQARWWQELALSVSDDPAPWLRRLEKAADHYVDEQLFLQWHRRLFDLYILARWLEIYVHLFLSLPQRLQQIGGDLSLVRLVRPASDPNLSGSGLWAPAIDRTLGYGVCLVIRELVRFDVVDGSRLGPYAWQPTRRLRALLHWLGMDLPNDAMPDRAPLIWRFAGDLAAMIRRLLAPSTRFVLAIGNEGGLLLNLAGGRIAGRWQIAGHDDAALATLAAPLAAAPKCSLVVVGDLLEQSYRKEAVPRLNRFDRAKVLKRRLERAFPGTPLKVALKLADDPEEPRSQNFLLVGVPPAADWDRWLGFLRSLENPVLALTLLPIEAAGMVTRLVRALMPAGRQPHSWAILISRQRTGGFRQIVVDQGELVLTRLTPSLAADAGPAGVAAEIRQELQATLGYMTRLGYRAGSSLDIVVLGDDELRARLDDGGPLPGQLAVVTAAEAAAILGVGAPGRADDVDGALLAAVWVGARRWPTLQLLPSDLRVRKAQRQALRWATAGLTASALGLISYSTLSAVSALEIEQEIGWLRAWQSTTQQRLARSASETDAIGG